VNGSNGTADAGGDARPVVTPAIAAEAAVWVAKLHGPARSSQMEQEFHAWQARSPAHREAFEKCTETWQAVPRVSLADAYGTVDSARAQYSDSVVRRRPAASRWGTAVAIAGVIAAAAVLVQQWRGRDVYSTGLGEQRIVLLEDGSRMLLNTATELRVDFEPGRRLVNVRSGEAMFEVAKDASRPFVVRVAGSEVVAVGTVFSVRYADKGAAGADELSVTLVEGQVNVRRADGVSGELAPERPLAMHAGERLKLDGTLRSTAGALLKVDRPNVEHVTAWKRSEAVFDATALPEAVAEMNRYNRTPITLVDGLGSSGLRVSGLYRTGDSAGFARAVASLYGLSVRETNGRLELGKPQ